MNGIFKFILLALLSTGLMAEENAIVTIDFAGIKPTKTIEVKQTPGMTALELLEAAAKVTTKHAGKYIFITSIDGVKSTPKKMGWFYEVDGKRAKKTASSYILENIKTMRWEYRTDNCLNRLK